MEPITKPLRRMRTAAGVLEALKAEDPGTEITLTYIRRIIREERIPVHSVGVKKLVALEDVLEYLSSPQEPESDPAPEPGIRRVPV